jgi:hypothetical protein
MPTEYSWVPASRTSRLMSFSLYRLWLSPPSDMMSNARLAFCAVLISLRPRYIASRSAVRPFTDEESRRLCRSSTVLVKVRTSSARSLKLTRKNSSCGLAVVKNCEAASLALPNFVDHAAAEIEDDADGNGDIFGREIPDLLLDVVFENTEVFGLKACNPAVMRVIDGNVDKRQVHIDWTDLSLMTRPGESCFTSSRTTDWGPRVRRKSKYRWQRAKKK